MSWWSELLEREQREFEFLMQREEREFEVEEHGHEFERDRLDQEVKKLQHQLQETTDENTKKHLQEELSITQAKREIAESKRGKAHALAMHRFYMKGGYVEWAQHYEKEAEEWKDKVKKNEEYLKKLESKKKKRKQYEEKMEMQSKKQSEKQSEKLLDEALKDGFVGVTIVVCIVLGQPGVGKTHLKYLLLDRRPPHLRNSTICAETPVRVEIRTVSGTKIQNIRGKWKEVSNEDMLDIVAKMILLAEPQLSQKSEQSIFSKVASMFSSRQGAAGAKLPTLKHPPRKGKLEQGSTEPTLSDSCQKAMKEIMDKIVQRISKLRSNAKSQEELHCQGGSLGQSVGEIILQSKWVYFTDSGGQPQYHELLPLFVRSISSALCVTRLTDKLDETQEVEYYQDGKQIGVTQQSQLSAKGTIQCLVNTIQSYSNQDQPPKIIMVGTHLDKLEEMCTKQPSPGASESSVHSSAKIESVEEKDQKLIEMLKPEFFDQLVFPSGDMKKLLFTLNALNPGKREEGTAQSIRHAVETAGARKERVPIWWYIMELLLQELARELGRGVLSRAECLEMARLLGICSDSFYAALEFFDKLNVIKYSPDVLPDVVFIESQIPLDKVSELVYHSYLLRQPPSAKSSLPVEGEWRHFRDRGIVSKACLKSERFSRHYVPGIFSVDDLCEILKKLLVFAPVPNPAITHQDDSTPSTSDKEKETHFVMPAALESLLEAALAQYRESSSEIAALLVQFPKGSRRAGVFCCFVVHLIKHFGWSHILDDTEPLYRNCFKIHLPTDPPCSVTLIDSNSMIEVYVKLAAEAVPSECSALLNVIKNAILSGIDAACIALNYKQTKPEFTFYCPHTSPSPQTSRADQSKELKPHTATLNDKKTFLTCDLVHDNSYPLQTGHLIWFGRTKVSSTSDESASSDNVKSYPTASLSSSSTPSAPCLSAVIQQPMTAPAPQTSAPQLPPIVEYASISSEVTTGLSHTSVTTLSRSSDELSTANAGLSSQAAVSSDKNTVASASSLSTSTPLPQGCVKFKHLTLIKWKDEKGELQQFYLGDNIAYKWRTIGALLGLTFSKLQSLEEEYRGKPEECYRAVLGHWLENPPPEYPTTWQGLIDLLEDSRLGQVVSKLRNALNKAINL